MMTIYSSSYSPLLPRFNFTLISGKAGVTPRPAIVCGGVTCALVLGHQPEAVATATLTDAGTAFRRYLVSVWTRQARHRLVTGHIRVILVGSRRTS